MAAYKARVTHETYKGRLRPRNHYALGWLPRWAGLVTRVPAVARLVNAVRSSHPGVAFTLLGAVGESEAVLAAMAGIATAALAALDTSS